MLRIVEEYSCPSPTFTEHEELSQDKDMDQSHATDRGKEGPQIHPTTIYNHLGEFDTKGTLSPLTQGQIQTCR